MYTHILVPVDFSDSSGLAVARAKNLTEKSGAKLTVLHVISYVPPGYIAAQIPASMANTDVLIDKTREYLAEWLKQYELSDCDQVVKAGIPKKEIVDAAIELSADLIVMGAHGEAGLGRFVGSTTSAVTQHSECDVLAARPAV